MIGPWSQERARLIGLLGVLFVVSAIRIVWELPRPQEYHGRWESQIRAFEARDIMKPPPETEVLLVGSSSIGMWDTAKRDLKPYTVLKRGFGGSCISDLARYADRIILPYEPRVVLVYAGDNDVAALKTKEQILEDFRSLVKIVRDALPDTRIGFVSVKPSVARWELREKIKRVNSAIKAYAEATLRVDYIDIFKPMLNPKGKPKNELFLEDGLHMNRKGYGLWSKAINKYLGRLDAGMPSK